MNLSLSLAWAGLLTAIARLLRALLAAVRDDRRKWYDETEMRNAAKAAGHDRLLAALKARRKAQRQWRKSSDNPVVDGGVPDRNRPDG